VTLRDPKTGCAASLIRRARRSNAKHVSRFIVAVPAGSGRFDPMLVSGDSTALIRAMDALASASS